LEGFVRCGFTSDEAQQLLIKPSTLAREVVDEFARERSLASPSLLPLVGASIGCYGATLADGSEYSASYIDSIDRSAVGTNLLSILVVRREI